jgi:hypothetical protein
MSKPLIFFANCANANNASQLHSIEMEINNRNRNQKFMHDNASKRQQTAQLPVGSLALGGARSDSYEEKASSKSPPPPNCRRHCVRQMYRFLPKEPVDGRMASGGGWMQYLRVGDGRRAHERGLCAEGCAHSRRLPLHLPAHSLLANRAT